MMFLMLRPFRVGDVIEGSGAAAGIVREVGLFTTRIERGDGNAVFVPNSQIWSNPVINYSSGGTQRIEVEVELAQRKDVDAAIGELKKLVADEPRVLSGSTLAPLVRSPAIPTTAARNCVSRLGYARRMRRSPVTICTSMRRRRLNRPDVRSRPDLFAGSCTHVLVPPRNGDSSGAWQSTDNVSPSLSPVRAPPFVSDASRVDKKAPL